MNLLDCHSWDDVLFLFHFIGYHLLTFNWNQCLNSIQTGRHSYAKIVSTLNCFFFHFLLSVLPTLLFVLTNEHEFQAPTLAGISTTRKISEIMLSPVENLPVTIFPSSAINEFNQQVEEMDRHRERIVVTHQVKKIIFLVPLFIHLFKYPTNRLTELVGGSNSRCQMSWCCGTESF